jgi:hypothetical protein
VGGSAKDPRTRTKPIPDGTKANAAGLSGCACVTRMRSGEKGEVRERGSARRLNESAWVVKPVRACLWRNADPPLSCTFTFKYIEDTHPLFSITKADLVVNSKALRVSGEQELLLSRA